MGAIHKSRMPKLSDSSRKLTRKEKKNKMNAPFVERIQNARNKKGNIFSGKMVEMRRQNVSEDKGTKGDTTEFRSQ